MIGIRMFDDWLNDDFFALGQTTKSLSRELQLRSVKRSVQDNKLSLTFEVPGLSKDDLEVSFENELLEVVSKKTEKKSKTEYRYKVTVKDIEAESIVAKCENGLLTVTANLKQQNKKKLIKVE